MVEVRKSAEKTYFKCPNCKNRMVWNDAKLQWEPQREKNGRLPDFLSNLIIGVGLFLIFLLFIGPVIGGDTGLVVHVIAFTLLALAVLILRICEKPASKAILVGIMVIYYLLVFGAVNNFPECIRIIPGNAFIKLWWTYSMAVYVLTLFAVLLAWAIIILSRKQKLSNMDYSDNDLMLLQDFSRYKLSGYYLIKAKLYGIIKYSTTKETEDTDSMVLVELNTKLPKKKLADYCDQDPQVKKIVEYLNERKEEKYEYTRVSDVVNGVKPEPEIQSAGGRAATDMLGLLKKVKTIIVWIAIALVYYVGYTKLFMGMHNGKAVEALAFGGFLISYIILAIFSWLAEWIFDKSIWASVVQMIVRKKHINLPNYEQYVQSFLTGDQEATDQEMQNILRYYATHKNVPSDHAKNTNINITHDILSAVFAAEAFAAAQAAKSSNSGNSGCSSCSSCSSCGGGGGGCSSCGGCGD